MSNELGKEEEPEVILTIEPPEAGKTLARTYTITGQDSRLSQVFRNLIDNARSFTAPGTTLELEIDLLDAGGDRARLKLGARNDGKSVATARIEVGRLEFAQP
jgi:signal transduction histidine kinase